MDATNPKGTETTARGGVPTTGTKGNLNVYDLADTKENLDVYDMPPGPITIAEALENVAGKIGDKPLTVSDARAIQSAEALATGIPSGVKGGPGAIALSAVDQSRSNPYLKQIDVTVGDVLKNASSHLPQDKIVTPRDASKVHSAEARNNQGQVQKGGVSSTMQHAAAYNQNSGFLNPQ